MEHRQSYVMLDNSCDWSVWTHENQIRSQGPEVLEWGKILRSCKPNGYQQDQCGRWLGISQNLEWNLRKKKATDSMHQLLLRVLYKLCL